MATRLRAAHGNEMTVGGTLSRGFGAIGAAPVTFFGVSFVLVALPYALLSAGVRGAVFQPAATGANPLAQVWPTLLALGVLWWILYILAQAVLFRATAAALDGPPGTIGDHALAGLRSVVPLFLLSILMSLAVWVGMIFLFVPGAILAMIWSVAAPALVIERCGLLASFGRSSRLTRGARWRIFGLCVLVFAIYWVAAASVGVGSIAANGVAAAADGLHPPLISTILSVALQTAFIAIWSAIQGALYLDLRDWKDGPQGERLADIFARSGRIAQKPDTSMVCRGFATAGRTRRDA